MGSDTIPNQTREVFVCRTYRVGTRGLGATGLFCDNDLVDGQNRSCGFGSELDGPVLGGQEVENAFLLGIQDASAVRVLHDGYVSNRKIGRARYEG